VESEGGATEPLIEEAWVREASGERAIRLRNLNTIMRRGVTVIEARLIEREDARWSIWIRVSDRPGEHRVNLGKSDDPKLFSDVALAIATVREDFGYRGPIVLSTERWLGAGTWPTPTPFTETTKT